MELMSSSNNPQESQSGTMSDTERWSSLITGGALVLSGLSQRSLKGALLALAGGGLAYHGVVGQKGIQERITETVGIDNAIRDKAIRVEKTVTIQNQSPETLYRFWHDFANLPTFMKHLKSVTPLSSTRSHWVANAPLGNSIEWNADIITDQENKLIAWTSVEGSDVDNSGFVRFSPTPAGRGTEVKVVLEYSPPGGALTAVFAKLFGEEPEQQIGDDIHRFKMLMEAGEIATAEGQSSGRQS
jgi:uncharacterized membrane protein